MKRSVLSWLVATVVLASACAGAEEDFSHTLRPEDFAAAGLGKLSPAERARLDALVRAHQSETINPHPAPAPAQARSPAPPASPAPPVAAASAPRQVTVAPGTQVEYSATESRMVGDFRGWESNTVFTLENGQRWRVTGGGTYATRPMPGPAVKIVPGILGSFWMTIEGVKTRVKVAPLNRP
ncbi:MAG: hypothetical protein Q7S40_27865 [Opitutaceae bacterium]|nr:hypothetical protein [Opitutaceae bacterium]